jgi:hypothetical protein
MTAPNVIERKSRGGGGGVTELLWGFEGTISTDQNGNILRYIARRTINIAKFFVNVVTAPVGGDVVIEFFVNGLSVATVTLLDGQTEAEVTQAVVLADGDEIHPEITSMTTLTPPTTMTFQAV